MADEHHLVQPRVPVWIHLFLSVFSPCLRSPPLQLLQLCEICPPTNIKPLHQCIYFCGTSVMRGITTDYLIPPPLWLLLTLYSRPVPSSANTTHMLALLQPCTGAKGRVSKGVWTAAFRLVNFCLFVVNLHWQRTEIRCRSWKKGNGAL